MISPSSSRQGSFYDPEYVCEQLIPPDSFYRKFREMVSPLITDRRFADIGLPTMSAPVQPGFPDGIMF